MGSIQQICMNCMRDMGAVRRICPYCHYDHSERKENEAQCLQKGTVLKNRYLVGRVLGQGGFGITYLGLEMNKKVRIAIKEYYPVGCVTRDAKKTGPTVQRVSDPQMQQFYEKGLKRFEVEARNLASLNSYPGIVKAYSFFYDHGTAYLIMEFIEGLSLKQYLKWYRTANRNNPDHNPLSYEVILGIMKPVIESLNEVHKIGLVHRDISPDNLIVDRSGKVTLIDFGAAKQQMAETEYRSTTIMVKHGYAPEEQYRINGSIGPWTDVYALCATMYRLISGVRPAEATQRLYKDDLVPLKKMKLAVKVPAKVSNAIMKGLAVEAKDRYQTMAELDEALGKAFPQLKEGRHVQMSSSSSSEMNPAESVHAWNQKYRTRNLTDHPTDPNWTESQEPSEADGKKKIWIVLGIILGVLIGVLIFLLLYYIL